MRDPLDDNDNSHKKVYLVSRVGDVKYSTLHILFLPLFDFQDKTSVVKIYLGFVDERNLVHLGFTVP